MQVLDLATMADNQNVSIRVAPILQGRLSKIDVIGPEAHMLHVINYENLSKGRFFLVTTNSYCLELVMTDDTVVLTRNNIHVITKLAPNGSRVGYFLLEVLWTPTKLGVTINDKSGKRENSVVTPTTFPPHILQEWARREALFPTVTYESPTALFEAVLDQLQQLRNKIVNTNAINGFWNIGYEGNTIVFREPKRETDIHPQIRLLLYDIELIKSLQIVPEYPIGTGELDFLITGRITEGQIVNVCLEFKLAHATDLAHGIQKQLPEYMVRRQTDFGIYCVLSFGEEYPANTRKFEIQGFNSENPALDFILPIAASHTGLPYLRSIIFDLSRRTVPSKA